MAKKVALVTGSQQGLGYGLVKELSKTFDGDVIVTGLTDEAAKEAQTKLAAEGAKAVAHQLDVRSQESIDKLHEFIKQNYDGLDILISNAGISYHVEVLRNRGVEAPPALASTTVEEIAKETMKVNFYGLLRVCITLFPLLRQGARVVHIGTNGARFVINNSSAEKKAQLTKKDWTEKDLCHFIHEYIEDVAAGDYKAKGWPENATYSMSKWGVWALAAVQQAQLDEMNKGIIVNVACPGIVATEMTHFRGESIEKGCETVLYLATLEAGASSPKGQLVYEKTICTYDAPPPGLLHPRDYFDGK